MIQNLTLNIRIKMNSAQECDIIFNALRYETFYSPNERATVRLKKEDDMTIELIITAQDPVSARAALNSYLRWFTLAQELEQLTH